MSSLSFDPFTSKTVIKVVKNNLQPSGNIPDIKEKPLIYFDEERFDELLEAQKKAKKRETSEEEIVSVEENSQLSKGIIGGYTQTEYRIKKSFVHYMVNKIPGERMYNLMVWDLENDLNCIGVDDEIQQEISVTQKLFLKK